MRIKYLKLSIFSFAILFFCNNLFACACGLSNLNVGTNLLLPSNNQRIAFVQYDSILQNTNFNGSSKIDAELNHHQKIMTKVTTFGIQQTFDNNWGFNLRIPHSQREITSNANHHDEEDHDHDHLSISSTDKNSGIGDIKVNAIYNGFKKDKSLGVIFGIKLPTGKNNDINFSKAAQLGTGSYDALLSLYYNKSFSSSGWFSQISFQRALVNKDDFRSGDELNLSSGLYHRVKLSNTTSISPMLQIFAVRKDKDSKINAESQDSGYKRVFVSFGPEISYQDLKFYTDIQIPLYQYVNGSQLAVDKIYRAVASYSF